jgi:hypothetical protein
MSVILLTRVRIELSGGQHKSEIRWGETGLRFFDQSKLGHLVTVAGGLLFLDPFSD